MNDRADDRTSQSVGAVYRWYFPRFWHGMSAAYWWRMLRRNRFAVSPSRLGLATTVSMVTASNSVLGAAQRLLLGRAIDAIQLTAGPLFLLGHWRSGTTLLHELMVRDPRFTFPDTYACFAPNHFVLTRKLFVPLLKFMLPAVRPMDNVPLGWDRPQEDEFALMNLGLLSPYESLAFPRRNHPGTTYLDCEDWDEEEKQRWCATLHWFLQCVTYCSPKQVVLKSPPHTCRLRLLHTNFPDARFVHIVRHPFALFGSTMRLWQTLVESQRLQNYGYENLEQAVIDGLEIVFSIVARQKADVPADQFVEVRYEDLVADPEQVMKSIYDHLKLGGFDEYVPRLRQYWQDVAGYQAGKYHLDRSIREEIYRRCQFHFDAHRYDPEDPRFQA